MIGWFVSDGFGSGDIFVEARVGKVGIGCLVGKHVIAISEPVLKPVAIQNFGVVRVLMHL